MIRIVIEGRLPSLANRSLHWADKARQVRRLRRMACIAVSRHMDEISKIYFPVHINLIRSANRVLDWDNLVYAFKPVRDGVADALFPEVPQKIRDENKFVSWSYEQQKKKESFVVIELLSYLDAEEAYPIGKDDET